MLFAFTTAALAYSLSAPSRSSVRMMATEVDTAAVGFGASHTSMCVVK